MLPFQLNSKNLLMIIGKSQGLVSWLSKNPLVEIVILCRLGAKVLDFKKPFPYLFVLV